MSLGRRRAEEDIEDPRIPNGLLTVLDAFPAPVMTAHSIASLNAMMFGVGLAALGLLLSQNKNILPGTSLTLSVSCVCHLMAILVSSLFEGENSGRQVSFVVKFLTTSGVVVFAAALIVGGCYGLKSGY